MTKKEFSWKEFYDEQKKDPEMRKHMEGARRVIEAGSKVYHARKKAGLLQRELADMANVSPLAVSNIEAGHDDCYSQRALEKVLVVVSNLDD